MQNFISNLFAKPAMAQGYYGHGYGMMGWYGPGDWIGGVFMFLFWIIIIGGIIFMLTRGNSYHSHDRKDNSENNRAQNILDERYAKGEITKEQYTEMKNELMKK